MKRRLDLDDDYLIKKAKKAVWWNKYFGFEVPLEYIDFIINMKCCDEHFLEKFVLRERLPTLPERDFLLDNITKNEELVIKYIKKWKCYGSQQIIIEFGSTRVIEALFSSIKSNSVSHLDTEAMIYIVTSKAELFKDVYQLAPSYFLFNDEIKNAIAQSANKEIIATFLENNSFDDTQIEKIITTKSEELLNLVISKQHFHSDAQKMLIKNGSIAAIKYYISKYKLYESTLCMLFSEDKKEILKFYYQTYSYDLPPNHILAYRFGEKAFREYLAD